MKRNSGKNNSLENSPGTGSSSGAEGENSPGPNTTGEIFICPSVARKNAEAQGKDWNFQIELALLMVHGMLHIYGFDHEEYRERMEMFGIQDSLVEDITVRFDL